MQEQDILGRVDELVAEEHQLRERLQNGQISSDEEHERLRQVEEQLDQCWDLLRQRRARRDAGEDPDAAAPRPVDEVETYLQ